MFDFNANDTLETLKPFVQWLHEHTLVAGLLTCLISLAESLAIIGYIIPGSIIMPAIGVLIGAGILPAWEIMFWAILGAVLGDGLSFWLGYHYHEQLRVMWPMNRYPGLLNRTELFFAQHGGKSVFIGRFVGAVRPMVPVVAGMMNMSPWRFYTANVLSGIIWAPAFLLPGILLGAASLELPPKIATQLLILLFIAGVILWIIVWLLKLGVERLRQMTVSLLNKTWVFLHRHPSTRPLCKVMRDPTQPYKHGQFSLSLLFVFSLLALCWMLTLPLKHPEIIPINQATDYLFKGLRSPMMDSILAWFSLMADKIVLIIPILTCSAWLAWHKQWMPAIHLLMIYAITAVFVYTFKQSIAAPRPAEIGLIADMAQRSFGFPSGHSALAVSIYGFFTLVLTRSWQSSGIKRLTYGLFVTFVVASVTTRMYLGAHWFTDVMGGVCLGLIALALVALSYRRFALAELSSRRVTSIALVSLMVGVIGKGLLSENLISRYHFQPKTTSLTINQWWAHPEPEDFYYLRNRFGRVESLINIQWLGDIDKIKATLENLGWQKVPDQTWVELLNRLNPDAQTVQFPLLPTQYVYQNPVLKLMKPATVNEPTQILSIWPSRIDIYDSNTPLWFANVEYYIPSYQQILNGKHLRARGEPTGFMQLKRHLPRESLKFTHYPTLPKSLAKRGLDSQVLLINSNN